MSTEVNNNNHCAGRKASGIFGRRSIVKMRHGSIHSSTPLLFIKERASSNLASIRPLEKRENAQKLFKCRRNEARDRKFA